MRPRWVGQQDIGGCGAATLAMILDWTYEQAKAAMDSAPTRHTAIDWSIGTSNIDIDYVLGEQGFFGHRVYITWQQEIKSIEAGPLQYEFRDDAVWPPKPFAPIHYAQVEQPSGHYHFVVMHDDGTVYDPMLKGDFLLTDWPKVLNVRGLVRA